MRYEDLPERWKLKLREYLIAKGSTKPYKLGASEFSLESAVQIQFEDNSKVEFNYAFAIEAPDLQEVAVFTEHCGYHLFPFYEGVEIIKQK